jgi:hypothetical protein
LRPVLAPSVLGFALAIVYAVVGAPDACPVLVIDCAPGRTAPAGTPGTFHVMHGAHPDGSPSPLNVVLGDDHAAARSDVRRLLEADPGSASSPSPATFATHCLAARADIPRPAPVHTSRPCLSGRRDRRPGHADAGWATPPLSVRS